MNNIKLLVLTIITVFSITIISCGQAESTEGEHQLSDHPNAANMHDANETDTDTDIDNPTDIYQGTLSKEKAQAILAAYLLIKDGLVATDAAKAKIGATQLLSALDTTVTMDDVLEAIKEDAEHIEGTGAASHQRDHFNTLTENVLKVVKATNANDGELYLQFCPMAFDSKGAHWLSITSEIRDPYFGEKMLRCGKTVETIN